MTLNDFKKKNALWDGHGMVELLLVGQWYIFFFYLFFFSIFFIY